MTIDYASIIKDILTWATAAKLLGGAFAHKAWQWLVAKYQAAKAEALKLEAEAKAKL